MKNHGAKQSSEIRRFFFADLADANEIHIEKSCDQNEFNHIKNSLRLAVGDTVEFVDGRGTIARATLQAVAKGSLDFSIQKREKHDYQGPKTVLIQSPLKPARMDWVIEKIVELGVYSYIPLISAHTTIKSDDAIKRRDRWQKIAVSALKQSKSLFLPEIADPVSSEELIKNHDTGPMIFCSTAKEAPPLLEALEKSQNSGKPVKDIKISLLIGPEGGFSDKETEIFNDAQFQPASLGYNILRAETASLAAMAIANAFLQRYRTK